jgi:starch synthase
MRSKVLTGGMKPKDVEFLAEPDAVNLAKTAIEYSDGVILANPDVDPALPEFAKSLNLPVLPFIDPQDPESTYITDYNRFYEKILETK